MNKKGVFNLVADLLIILIVLLAILGAVYFGFWKKTEDIVKSKLPAAEKLKTLIDKIITSPGEATIEKQKAQAEDIAIAIKKTINQMNDVDCIEKLDYGNLSDKDFILEFKEENGKNTLGICKMIGGQCGPFFNFPYTPVYYFIEQLGESITAKGSPTPIDKISNFEITDELNKINKEEIGLFLYKDREGNVGFFSKRFYDINFKYKQICSDGTYLETVDWDKLNLLDYKRIELSETSYTNGLNEYKDYLGVWIRNDEEVIWRNLGGGTPLGYKTMTNIINEMRKQKFKIDIE